MKLLGIGNGEVNCHKNSLGFAATLFIAMALYSRLTRCELRGKKREINNWTLVFAQFVSSA